MKSTRISSVSQPACLLAIRPTSRGRIGPVFSHNARYRCATTDLLIQLRFIHCTIVSPFILHCFSFSLTVERKGEKLLIRCRWIVMAYTYYVTQMAKCTCTWLHHPFKLLTSTVFLLCTDTSHAVRMVLCWDLYVCSWAVICQYSCC